MYYLHPTDEELRSQAGIPKEKGKKGKGGGGKGGSKGGGEDEGGFTVPRSLDLTLETSPLGHGEVIQLRFYSEYQWLLDFSLCAVLVYIMTEVSWKNYYYYYYHYFYLFIFFTELIIIIFVFLQVLMAVTPPRAEVNLSMLWCLMAIGFSLYPFGGGGGGDGRTKEEEV